MTPATYNQRASHPDDGWATFNDLEAEYGAMLDAVTAEAYPRDYLRRTRMGDTARDNLSRCVTALCKFGRSTIDSWADLQMFHAPSECYADTARYLDRQANDIAKDFGYDDTDAVYDALLGRVTFRIAYELAVTWAQ
jgi:hypothetical protein